jgi:F0F1-type ATP synthase membrane subunit c/vacuolar-type H+-ATPase subunit K
MDHFFHVLVVVLTALFVLGCAGCAIVIPIVAAKFLAVLFENKEEPEKAGQNSAEL